MFALAFTLVLSLGCRNKDAPDDTAPFDLDDDGFTLAQGDCDDENAAINPDAEEICDGLDNNCDEVVDEGLTETWWLDGDEDGFGDTEAPAELCGEIEGYVDNEDDCDDSNADVHPDAIELCNALDDNCDGDIDEAGEEPWYADADGDGYGDAAVSISECDPDGAWVPDDTDCDDEDALVNPGMDDICNLADDDCDGDIDEDPEFTWYMDLDSDGFGSSTEVQSCVQPESTSDITGDCDDGDDAIHPDADEVCDDFDNDCDGVADNDDALDALNWYTDTDGDGFGDDSTVTTACSQPSGLVAEGGDCDETSTDINPDADEACDGVDTDCNGVLDDDYATDASTWYADTDSDSFGDPNSTTTACDQPSGYLADDQDCDDTNTNINPDAEEVCSDGIDDDCDGTADQDCPVEHCGTISSSETWTATDDHLITCNVSVQGTSKPVLTIEDGANVYFSGGTYLSVGWSSYGSLDVQGTSTGVTFSSDESSPAEGDWEAVYIGYYDQGSLIDGLTLEYSGNAGYGMYAYYSDPEITNSTFQNNDGDGLYVLAGFPLVQDSTFQDNVANGISIATSGGLDDSGSTPTFTGNTLTGNGGYPISLPALYVNELDNTSTFSGNTDDSILVLSDSVTKDSTWQNQDVAYEVQDTIYIQGSNRPELVIEDGAEITFQNNVHMYVGWNSYGSISVEGTSTGVTMSSSEATPAAGDWKGLAIGYYDQGSTLEGLTLSYGGDNGYGGLYAYYADITIIDSSFTDNDNDGLYVAGTAELDISGSTFQDNDGNGITLGSYGTLDDSGSTASFVNNTLTGNGGYPMSLAPDQLGQLDSTSSFTGNTDDYIEVLAGYVTDDATWQALDTPYLALGRIYIQASSKPEVEIEDGFEMAFDNNAGLVVGWSSYGSLTVSGVSTANGVTFTSAESSPAAGDWDGITIGYYTDTAELAGFTVEYGGDNGYGGVYVYYTDTVLSDCTISDNDGDGVLVTGAGVEISDCTLENNDANGLQLSTSGTLEASFDSNTVTGNGDYPVLLPANELGELDSSSAYTGNGTDLIFVEGDYVDDDATWQLLDVDYTIGGHVYIQGSGRPHVTVEDGTTFYVDSSVIRVGWGSYGSMEVSGGTTGVTFTSAESSPAAGDWDGLVFGYYCQDNDVDLDGITVEYGGDNGYGNIWWYYCDGTIDNATITDSDAYGMYRSAATPSIGTVSYSNNSSGDLY